jgi:hypothetical protein
VSEGAEARPGPLLNENQRRRVMASCQYIDKLLSDLDKVVAVASSGSPFDRYVDDLTREQKTLLRDYSGSIRAQMLRVLKSQGAMPTAAPGSARHAIRSGLNFIEIALEELKPEHMRGSGEMAAAAVPELNALVQELQALVARLDATLAASPQAGGGDRLGLIPDGPSRSQIEKLAGVIDRRGLVECRPAFDAAVDTIEERLAEMGASIDRPAIGLFAARKAEALRDAVEAALRARLGREQRAGKTPVDAAAIETELRKAVGGFEDVRKLCEPLRDRSPRVVFEALELAAERATKVLDYPESHPAGVAVAVRAAVVQVAVDRADDIRGPIGTFIGRLRAALTTAARALGLPESTSADEWSGLMREMPAFEIGELPVEEPKVFLRKVLGSGSAHARMRKAIESQIGPAITEALNAHGLALYEWSQRTLTRVRHQFDATADVYRAQLSQPRGEATSEEAAAIRDELGRM